MSESMFAPQTGGDVVVALTPNGREIRRRPDGRYEVQPKNDNYWIIVDSIKAAYDAYYRPAKYRP
jgi:hypothetical protein